MDKYLESKTWQLTLGRDNENKEAVEKLRNSYVNARDNAEVLAKSIRDKLPYFTVHDITHIDALWIAADTLLWDKNENALYELNPAEAYVLGLAFLLHDLGMGLVSYSDGFEGLRKEKYFRDSLASEFRKEFDRTIDESDWCRLDGDYASLGGKDISIVHRAVAATLRDLHSKKAEQLALQKWQLQTGDDVYIIEDTNLREAFGELAGKLAASHGWGYDALREGFSAAPSGTTSVLPAEWTINARKLALILRLSDAIQIDDSRAPSFLMALKKLEGESLDHHKFQNKLNQPAVKDERLFFTSKSSFKLEDMEAWWLCHDTLKMIDEELRSADTLLLETGRRPFLARGVYGLSSAKDLSAYVKVEGWTPLDTKIRVGNVGKLVKMLGGEQLYGNNSKWVPFRELIQNGTDAVRARRLLKPDRYTGEVRISFEERDGEQFILFFDNGIGMSEAVLTGPFLDFGQSFWGTGLMNREFPGLAAKGFKSTGRFGIGFYSVFMWSDDVKVITKRFGDNQRTLVLEFKNSVNTRPTLRAASDDEAELIYGSGTVVRIRLSNELADSIKSGKVFKSLYEQDYDCYFLDFDRMPEHYPLDKSLARLCPALDCDLYLEGVRIVEADDWKSMPPKELLKRYKENYSITSLERLDNAEEIYFNGKMIGRAAIDDIDLIEFNIYAGCLVSGGIFVGYAEGFVGIIECDCSNAVRNSTIIDRKNGVFEDWCISQSKKVANFEASAQESLFPSFLSFGFVPHKLCLTRRYPDVYLSYDDIVALCNNEKYNVCYVVKWIFAVHHLPFMPLSESFYEANIVISYSPRNRCNVDRLIEDAICEGFGIQSSDRNNHFDDHAIISDYERDNLLTSLECLAIYRNAIPQKEDIIDQ